MNNLYNAKICFKGEGNFTFTLPNYGELTVYNGKDIYIKGLTVSAVELLRQLRPLLLEHTLNAKPDGCYRVIDLTRNDNITKIIQPGYIEKNPIKSVADLKSDLIKTTGPIIEEEPVVIESNSILSNKEVENLKDSDIIDVKAPEIKVEKSKRGLGKRKSLSKSKR